MIVAITSGRPPRGMRMLVHPLEMRGPMASLVSYICPPSTERT